MYKNKRTPQNLGIKKNNSPNPKKFNDVKSGFYLGRGRRKTVLRVKRCQVASASVLLLEPHGSQPRIWGWVFKWVGDAPSPQKPQIKTKTTKKITFHITWVTAQKRRGSGNAKVQINSASSSSSSKPPSQIMQKKK